MQIHSNATTTIKQRVYIKNSSESYRSLTNRFRISPATVHRWKHRDYPHDRSCQPRSIRYALSPDEEKLILLLRACQLSLDDILDALYNILPNLSRSSIYRLLKRHGINRLGTSGKKSHGRFPEYPPGYLHIDYFYLPRLDKVKRYCFVAVDRATRLVYLKVYETRTKHVTTDFLRRCLEFYPFRIRTILTDNCRSFTHKCFKNAHGTRTRTAHPFEEVCRVYGIDYRKIKPRTPKTNGMVERTIGLIRADTTNRTTYPSAAALVEGLHNWFIYYNFYRRHRRIGRVTPYEKMCQWHASDPDLFIKELSHLLNFRSQRGET